MQNVKVQQEVSFLIIRAFVLRRHPFAFPVKS